jgi:hypothetical protein
MFLFPVISTKSPGLTAVGILSLNKGAVLPLSSIALILTTITDYTPKSGY